MIENSEFTALHQDLMKGLETALLNFSKNPAINSIEKSELLVTTTLMEVAIGILGVAGYSKEHIQGLLKAMVLMWCELKFPDEQEKKEWN